MSTYVSPAECILSSSIIYIGYEVIKRTNTQKNDNMTKS